MLKVDEFESAFRSADKRTFHLEHSPIKRALLVTDLDDSSADGGPGAGPFQEAGGTHDSFGEAVKSLLPKLANVEWEHIRGSDYDDVQSLLDLVQKANPDVVFAYRNLKDGSWRWPYSLGVFLNVLTRETKYPVVILPNPNEFPNLGWAKPIKRVMALTDHLAGDDSLVNWGIRFTPEDGALLLCHVEDDLVFDRYMDVISKVPQLDTEVARSTILKQLLKEPHDYILSARDVVKKKKLVSGIEEVIRTGHRVEDYEQIIEDERVDLVGVRTSDDDQVALHGATYLLAVKVRSLPLLMI